jgi:hypothetical protein
VTAAILQRLTDLRRRREKRALEALTVETGLLRRAEQQMDEAERTVRDHANQTRVREQQLIGALCGRAVTVAAIIRAQAELDGAAHDAAQLRAAAAQAQADLATRQNAHKESRANYLRRQRAVTKLERVGEQEAARQLLRDVARSDAENEDLHAAAAASKQS